MPIYEYQCVSCAHRFELKQSMKDDPIKECPRCGKEVTKLISSPAIMFKGSGWYITDYSDKMKPGSGGDSPEKAAAPGSEKTKTPASSETTTAGSSSTPAPYPPPLPAQPPHPVRARPAPGLLVRAPRLLQRPDGRRNAEESYPPSSTGEGTCSTPVEQVRWSWQRYATGCFV